MPAPPIMLAELPKPMLNSNLNRLHHLGRLFKLRQLAIIEAPRDESLDRLTRLASQLLHVPMAIISVVDERRQIIKSQFGVPEPYAQVHNLPLSRTLCQYVVRDERALILHDVSQHPALRNGVLLSELGMAAYAGVPLVTHDGWVLGTFAAMDTKVRMWKPEEIRLLSDLASSASAEIKLGAAMRQSYAESKEIEAASLQVYNENKAKQTLLANVSHEIRTPLTAILGFTELLQESSSPLEAKETISAIRRNSEFLLALANDLLDLAKYDAGRVELQMVPIDPWTLVQEVIQTFVGAAEQKGLALVAETTPCVPREVVTDPTRLRQILNNLCSNAIKFTERGKVKVSLGPFRHVGSQPQLAFAISDTGVGIPQGDHPRIFEPFAKAISRPKHITGTGLGLAISRRLVKIMGGEIQLESKPGQGSTFLFSIMLGADKKNVSHVTPNPLPTIARDFPGAEPKTNRGSPKKTRILLAEDTLDTQKLLCVLLGRRGFEIAVASDGRDACERVLAAELSSEPYDLVLMDMTMPVMDGIAATRYLRKCGFPKPIIALTAHAMAEDQERCRSAGCDDFAAKPIEFPDLVARIRHWMEISQHSYRRAC